MSIERLERVMWRLSKKKKPKRTDLELAIMKECGTSPACIRENKKALQKLKWITYDRGIGVNITGRHITEE